MSDKEQLITMLNDELNRWETLLGMYGEDRIVAPQQSNMSIKDEIAHLMAWQQRTIARMEAALQNTDPVFPDWPADMEPEQPGEPHDVNAWIYKMYRDQPWPSVHSDWRAGFQKLIAIADAIPEQDLVAAGKYPWLDGEPLSTVLVASAEHHAEHRGELVARMK